MVDFDPCCLIRFVIIMTDNQLSQNVLSFSCNTFGQLCLGGPGYKVVALLSLALISNASTSMGIRNLNFCACEDSL